MNNNNKISTIQYSIFLIFPILSIFSGIGLHNIINISKTDCYISVIISFILGLTILGLTIYISNYEKGLNINEKINKLFGKYLSPIINILIGILLSIIAIVIIYDISNFIVSQYLQTTPTLVIAFLLGLAIIYNISKGLETITRTNIILLIIILLLSIFSFIFLIPNYDISNIKPTLENGIITPIKGSIILTLTNVIPIFTILTIPKNKVLGEKKVSKFLLISYIITYIMIFIVTFSTISVLGIYLSHIYQYPEYMVLKKISILNLFDRIENIIFIKWILSSFSTLTLIIYYINNSIKKDNKNIIIPSIITILLIFISLKYFIHTATFTNFIENIYPFTNLILLLIIIIISITILFKKKKLAK